jgi:hypothetical protein
MTDKAEAEMRLDFKSGKITHEDIKVIKRWVTDIEEQGLNSVQHKPDW